ncbi:ATP-dependent RNA helicase HrpB [Segatella copri]|nr:ATP-dependent RNA helicase HrpB [Segatella copri]
MSATIDASIICQALQAPLIESKGRMFPIETIYADHDIDRYQVAQEMAATICQAFRNQEGDILAFFTRYTVTSRQKSSGSQSLLPNRVNGKSYWPLLSPKLLSPSKE